MLVALAALLMMPLAVQRRRRQPLAVMPIISRSFCQARGVRRLWPREVPFATLRLCYAVDRILLVLVFWPYGGRERLPRAAPFFSRVSLTFCAPSVSVPVPPHRQPPRYRRARRRRRQQHPTRETTTTCPCFPPTAPPRTKTRLCRRPPRSCPPPRRTDPRCPPPALPSLFPSRLLPPPAVVKLKPRLGAAARAAGVARRSRKSRSAPRVGRENQGDNDARHPCLHFQ